MLLEFRLYRKAVGGVNYGNNSLPPVKELLLLKSSR